MNYNLIVFLNGVFSNEELLKNIPFVSIRMQTSVDEDARCHLLSVTFLNARQIGPITVICDDLMRHFKIIVS